MTFKKLSEILSATVSVCALAGMVSGTVWYFVDNEVGDKLGKLTGSVETRAALERTNQAVGNISREIGAISVQLRELENRIENVEPRDRIIEIDDLRSLVRDDCPTEGVCQYTWRMRRTELGASCSAPAIRRFVIDRFGVTHPVETVDINPGQVMASPDGDWTEMSNTFYLPDSVPEGVAEFYMEMVYADCFADEPDRIVRERTPELIFGVNPR